MKTFLVEQLKNDNAPVGFYKNTNETFKGLILKDRYGTLTYFDIEHSSIYPVDMGVWGQEVFIYCPDISVHVKLPGQKSKSTKLDLIK